MLILTRRPGESLRIEPEGAVPTEAGTTLRLGHTDPADGLRHKAATVFADKVKEHTEGKTVRKVIVVPGRLVNVVAN